MAICKEEFIELIKPSGTLEKKSTICGGEKNKLVRIPREVVDFLKIKNGNKINWIVNPQSKSLSIEISR